MPNRRKFLVIRWLGCSENEIEKIISLLYNELGYEIHSILDDWTVEGFQGTIIYLEKKFGN